VDAVCVPPKGPTGLPVGRFYAAGGGPPPPHSVSRYNPLTPERD